MSTRTVAASGLARSFINEFKTLDKLQKTDKELYDAALKKILSGFEEEERQDINEAINTLTYFFQWK